MILHKYGYIGDDADPITRNSMDPEPQVIADAIAAYQGVYGMQQHMVVGMGWR